MNSNFNLLALSISDLILITLFLILTVTQKNKSQLKNVFIALLACIALWVTPLIFKILLANTSINPYIFECVSGVGNYFAPVLFLSLSNTFVNTKTKWKPYKCIFLIIPIISSFLLWTNEKYHLLFEYFSPSLDEIVYGKFYYITVIYMYSIYFYSMIKLILYSLKGSSAFTRQTLFIIIGSAIPLVTNILGTLKLITITTYTTPITFSFTLLCFSLAIFKFNFLKTTPIALQRVVDRMSDSYIILDPYYTITDFNKTFFDTFNLEDSDIRNKNIFTCLNQFDKDSNIAEIFKNNIDKLQASKDTISFNQNIESMNKIFTIEISNIYSDNLFIGFLVLFKDITQHQKDMEIIQSNQDMLIEKERLASLGQMIGGIAHNLKTPIFSITGGLEGLSDLIKEYDSSIEDSTVTNEDMHEIAKDMNNWIVKLKEHIAYMSDVITAVKGQAVTLSEENVQDFNTAELFKYVDILMKHELKNSLTNLNFKNTVNDSIMIKGNINGLVQVINNLISNAIDAYDGVPNKEINLTASLLNSEGKILISVQDFGPGISENVKNKLFKEMITTKGKNGTGLGLFMSYSNIKAHFNGDLYFESEEGHGTTFFIKLPV